MGVPKFGCSAEIGLPEQGPSADDCSAKKLTLEASELSLRQKLIKDEIRFRKTGSRQCLNAVQSDRGKLADILLSGGKISEAEKLFQDATRDEEARNGLLEDSVAEQLKLRWIGMEMKNEKVRQVEQSISARLPHVKEEVLSLGVSPRDWLVDAVANSRVLLIGEEHTFDEKNSHREFLSTVMQDLRAAGATHLAVEFPRKYQAVLGQALQTGHWDAIGKAGAVGGDYAWQVVASFQQDKESQNVLNAAEKAGLKVVAVDSAEDLNRGRNSAIYGSQRDKQLASQIASILSADDQAKVVFWGGARHAATNPGEVWHDSAGEILNGLGYKVASLTSVIPSTEAELRSMPLYPMTQFVQNATAVPINKTKALSEFPARNDYRPGNLKYSAWDAVIIYPQK